VPDSAQAQKDAPRSPFAGCLILIVMAVVILVLISSAAYFLKKQTDAYKTFTDEEARPAPVADPKAHESEFNSLVNRLRHFDHEVNNGRAAELALSAQDLNLAIAHFDVLKSYRGQFHFEKITATNISGTIHLPFNSTSKLPGFVRSSLGIESRENNLNGTFTGTPLLTDGKLILNVSEITPSKGEIPEELLSGISRFLISGELEQKAEDDPKNIPELLKTLRKLTSIELREESLIFSYTPDSKPPSVKEESDAMATKAKQLVALGAVIFILTMILFFILMSRRQKAKRAAAQSS
jgi:flagellar basal body-associated protein FliL